MSIDKKHFIDYYAKQARDNDTSLFLGAGVSASAGYPSWKKLLAPCAKQLGLDIDDASIDFLMLAQYYANEYGYSALKRVVNENINRLNHESVLVDKLLNLNFQAIWTTNYDTVLERNLFSRNVLANSIYDDRDLANTNKSGRVNIYKLNGDISNLDKIVITQNDLESYSQKHELLLTFFKRELVMSTFLFLGYSFSDQLVLSCLNSVNRCLGDSANFHFSILKREGTPHFGHFVKDLETRYHVRVLLINDYEELPVILEELNVEIKKKNVFFSGVFERLPTEEDVFAERICKQLSKALIGDGHKIYTGYGRNFGNYLAGSSVEYLLSNNLPIERSLVMRPFLQNMSPDQKKAHREMLIEECPIAIFMFGQVPYQNEYVNSTGMKNEFDIALKKGKYVIPIGSTGYTAQEIWQDVRDQIVRFPYLERYMNILNGNDVEAITSAVVHIIREVTQ